MIHSHELINVGSLISQVREVTKVLLNYFEEDDAPKKTIQKLKSIQNELDTLLKYVVDSAYKELEVEMYEEIRLHALTEWKKHFDGLLKTLDYTLKTTTLPHAYEIKSFNERLKETFLHIKVE